MIYTVFVPNNLKVANSPENSIENKIQQFIGTDVSYKIVYLDGYLKTLLPYLSEPNSFYVNFLSELPSNFPKGIVAAALSERKDSQMQMVYNKQGLETKNGIKHKSLLDTGMIELTDCEQLEAIDDTILPSLYDLEPAQLRADFISQKLDAIFLPAVLMPFYATTESVVHSQNYHFSEIVPPVGSGVLCALTLVDATETRKFLRPHHHAATAECVNVERQLKKLAEYHEISAFVYTDASHYFHLYAAYLNDAAELKRVQISRSTTFELAETAWAELCKS